MGKLKQTLFLWFRPIVFVGQRPTLQYAVRGTEARL